MVVGLPLRADTGSVDMARHICEAIKNAREVAGLTQRRLAEMLNVTQPTVHAWEVDREPSLDQIAAIEAALELRRGQLLRDAGYVDGDDPPSPEQVIRSDETLTPEDRRALLDVLGLYRGRGGRGGR